MDLISTDWRDDAEHILPDLVDLRRAIHAEPELGLQNPKTLAKIKYALAGLPLEFREGPSTTGLIATLKGPANGRTVLLRALRPDLRIEPLRGNLDTRLRKLDEGQYAGIVLAASGLKRLGLQARIRQTVAEVVGLQAKAGVDLVNDGEMSKPSYATYIKDRLGGFGGTGNSFVYQDLADFPVLERKVFGDPGRSRRKTPACPLPPAQPL